MAFSEKTIVVTGASSGMGQALALALAERGVSVVAVGEHRAFVTADYESRLAEWREWEPVSIAVGA